MGAEVHWYVGTHSVLVEEDPGGILPPFQDMPIWVQVEGNIYRQVQNGLIYVRYLDEKNNIQYLNRPRKPSWNQEWLQRRKQRLLTKSRFV